MKSIQKVGVWLFKINSLNVLPNDIYRTKSNLYTVMPQFASIM
jgi:hypothetical protein